ncbi:DUF4142 domain-containing protein [Tianweitania sp. BSSL-BM11]|uniref:DUF4142 domain-containing protein n=1 Tax=Tianweitania aestuarii TaxID=2814886 RepID=A0ABS5RSV3_9HYPH|nr:DUF4142 domain-containing protein [Tianweitania aestuarii]MBS9719309.1 DUF4142 domain-containing protein [Tianweitania aestuarii]
MKTIISAVAASLLLSGAAYAQTKPATETTQVSPSMKVDTAEFVAMASSSNMFEIESSKLAEDKSKSDDVKAFAEQMIKDHIKAGEEMKAAAGDMPAAKLDPKHQDLLDKLKAAEGDDFDKQYVDMQKKAHTEAITLFTNYSQSGDDEKLVAFAKKTLPTLEMHKEHVEKLMADM